MKSLHRIHLTEEVERFIGSHHLTKYQKKKRKGTNAVMKILGPVMNNLHYASPPIIIGANAKIQEMKPRNEVKIF